MKLWLDDLRIPPSKDWTWVRNVDQCINLLSHNAIVAVSLDHDLGTEKTGYDVLCWMEQMVMNHKYVPPIIYIHSANPVGRRRMFNALDKIASIIEEKRYMYFNDTNSFSSSLP